MMIGIPMISDGFSVKLPPIEPGDRTPAPGQRGRQTDSQTDRQSDRHEGTLADPIGVPIDRPAAPSKSRQNYRRQTS